MGKKLGKIVIFLWGDDGKGRMNRGGRNTCSDGGGAIRKKNCGDGGGENRKLVVGVMVVVIA